MEVKLRKWSTSDTESLACLCNNVDRKFLSDRMPMPYTLKDAEWWLNIVTHFDGKRGIYRCITIDDIIVGSISIEKKQDVYRKNAEIGYMLQTEMWSRGIMTQAINQTCKIAFSLLDIVRITALVYESNTASRRALEKNDFAWEGLVHKGAIKDNKFHNVCIYGKLKDLN